MTEPSIFKAGYYHGLYFFYRKVCNGINETRGNIKRTLNDFLGTYKSSSSNDERTRRFALE